MGLGHLKRPICSGDITVRPEGSSIGHRSSHATPFSAPWRPLCALAEGSWADNFLPGAPLSLSRGLSEQRRTFNPMPGHRGVKAFKTNTHPRKVESRRINAPPSSTCTGQLRGMSYPIAQWDPTHLPTAVTCFPVPVPHSLSVLPSISNQLSAPKSSFFSLQIFLLVIST